jgi:glucose/arabinose dehydrogenase
MAGLSKVSRRMMSNKLNRTLAYLAVAWIVCCMGGCARTPMMVRPKDQIAIDRHNVDYPAGFELKLVARNFTAPVAMAFHSNDKLIAEAGLEGEEPQIWVMHPNGTLTLFYPFNQRIPFSPVQVGFEMYGPIGGMIVDGDKVYVSHRDSDGYGVISELGFDGSHHTVVAGLPAQGDYGVTDLAVNRDRDGNARLYFGIGSATNSGIVGLDNMRWLRGHRGVCDQNAADLELLGLRYLSKNPFASLFSPTGETADTGPFQPFGKSDITHIRKTPTAKPNSAVCSVALSGGDFQVEAWAIHNPRGLVFLPRYSALYVTNQGMELRGSRPVKDDPDALLRVYFGGPPTWYGYPDYSADMQPINKPKFQEPNAFPPNNVPKVGNLIDHEASDLREPNRGLLKATFPPLSGAAKMAYAPATGPLANRFRNDLFVALSGDRAPFATSGFPLVRPVGYKVVRVDDNGKVEDFIYNVDMLPASKIHRRGFVGLERPIDVKIGPDGTLYVLDMGEVEYKSDGRQVVPHGSGKLRTLVPANSAATPP